MEKETKKFSLSSKIFGKNNIGALVISKRLKFSYTYFILFY